MLTKRSWPADEPKKTLGRRAPEGSQEQRSVAEMTVTEAQQSESGEADTEKGHGNRFWRGSKRHDRSTAGCERSKIIFFISN